MNGEGEAVVKVLPAVVKPGTEKYEEDPSVSNV